MVRPTQWDKLPWFADDKTLGAALLGPERACEWPALAALYELKGLPKIDPRMGGRYVPAVKAFFDHAYGLDRSAVAPAAPDGIERPEAWTTRSKRRA